MLREKNTVPLSVQPFSDPSVLQIPTKPPTKEPTEPIDHVLHSDVRVVRRVKFDTQVSCPLRCSLVVANSRGLLCNGCLSILQVAERNSFMEEVKLERERQQKVCCLYPSETYSMVLVRVHLVRV